MIDATARLTGSERHYPPWVVLHVPHDSVEIPNEVQSQFLLDNRELAAEVTRMTDHKTLALFAQCVPKEMIVRAPVSRLVVDVERFEEDQLESMAARGMGAVYFVTSELKPLRRPLMRGERDALTESYYRPHHLRLEAAVKDAIDRFGRCLVIDCHSFPSRALKYEMADPSEMRSDICIGTDDFHTSLGLAAAFRTRSKRLDGE